jgi:hypothetical protein
VRARRERFGAIAVTDIASSDSRSTLTAASRIFIRLLPRHGGYPPDGRRCQGVRGSASPLASMLHRCITASRRKTASISPFSITSPKCPSQNRSRRACAVRSLADRLEVGACEDFRVFRDPARISGTGAIEGAKNGAVRQIRSTSSRNAKSGRTIVDLSVTRCGRL